MIAGELRPSPRILLGPGPSNVNARVLRALSTPLVGHLDPEFIKLMDETKALLRFVFETENELTLPISGTGSAGMEACLINLLEEGDEAIVAVNGVFGTRMIDIVERCRAKAIAVEAPWGRIVDPADIATALRKAHKPKLVAAVHAETSTGVLQPLDDIARLAHESGALFVVDAVTSLGGVPVQIDERRIDACYSGTQKCLSCPPGLSPLTFGDRALEVLRRRRSKVPCWYLDLSMIEKYWGEERVYHHTAPISMNYALREALRLVEEEGLEPRFARHRRNHEALKAGLRALGISMASQEGHELPTLNCVSVPEGIDETAVRRELLDGYGIEIGAGLGPFRGKVWRIGLMGESSTEANVLLLLTALERALSRLGRKLEIGAAAAASASVYRQA